jgi:hypothetical protein
MKEGNGQGGDREADTETSRWESVVSQPQAVEIRGTKLRMWEAGKEGKEKASSILDRLGSF